MTWPWSFYCQLVGARIAERCVSLTDIAFHPATEWLAQYIGHETLECAATPHTSMVGYTFTILCHREHQVLK